MTIRVKINELSRERVEFYNVEEVINYLNNDYDAVQRPGYFNIVGGTKEELEQLFVAMKAKEELTDTLKLTLYDIDGLPVDQLIDLLDGKQYVSVNIQQAGITIQDLETLKDAAAAGKLSGVRSRFDIGKGDGGYLGNNREARSDTAYNNAMIEFGQEFVNHARTPFGGLGLYGVPLERVEQEMMCPSNVGSVMIEVNPWERVPCVVRSTPTTQQSITSAPVPTSTSAPTPISTSAPMPTSTGIRTSTRTSTPFLATATFPPVSTQTPSFNNSNVGRAIGQGESQGGEFPTTPVVVGASGFAATMLAAATAWFGFKRGWWCNHRARPQAREGVSGVSEVARGSSTGAEVGGSNSGSSVGEAEAAVSSSPVRVAATGNTSEISVAEGVVPERVSLESSRDLSGYQAGQVVPENMIVSSPGLGGMDTGETPLEMDRSESRGQPVEVDIAVQHLPGAPTSRWRNFAICCADTCDDRSR